MSPESGVTPSTHLLVFHTVLDGRGVQRLDQCKSPITLESPVLRFSNTLQGGQNAVNTPVTRSTCPCDMCATCSA